MVDLFVGFRVGDSNDIAALIGQRSHIKSLFVSMLHQIWNLKYFKHFKITNCVGLEPFILVINPDDVSSSNTFSTLVSMFKCNVLLF